MMQRGPVGNLLLVAGVCLGAAGAAQAAPTNLSTWTAEGSGGNWVRAADNNSVTQTINGTPTVFYSDFDGQGVRLSGTIRVNTSGDDDFIGFVLGFNGGDLASTATDFLLIDWKQTSQNYNGFAPAGLALSRVTGGLRDNAGAWAHNPALGVTELARANTLGATGWADFQTYTFDIAFTANNVRVLVDDVLQFDVNGTFANGSFGFYNYSQSNVTYAGITDEILPPPASAVPEPGSWAMMIAGFGLVGAAARRRTAASVVA
ncbi:hypothetical protein GGQ62_001396 [Polymorphobacter fuscus]|uniref:PEPxxWA-CTERM sorting domain-containing protein n=1 Tax=Sandarakinorhabdus fusca TaxID=1439888 RepID=UPI0016A8438A|nr:hypothetical protein [Polymorphobacter fuscus]